MKRLDNVEITGESTIYLATNLKVVKLPKGEDFNDWLAVHVVDFFNRCSLCFRWQIFGGMKEELWSASLAMICTGSTWSMALFASSAAKKAVPPCQEELNLSTFGRWDCSICKYQEDKILCAFDIWLCQVDLLRRRQSCSSFMPKVLCPACKNSSVTFILLSCQCVQLQSV